MANGYAHKGYVTPLLGEGPYERFVFGCFLLDFAWKVEVRTEPHFNQDEGALLLVEGRGVRRGGIRDPSGVDEVWGDSIS